jgi:hypothetical protein
MIVKRLPLYISVKLSGALLLTLDLRVDMGITKANRAIGYRLVFVVHE